MYGKAPKEYLSLWSVIALGIGSMVGAGIFALMGQATLMAGKNVYWSFILGGVAALLSGYTYAKLGSRYPGSGGIMDYFNEAFSHKTLSGALTLIYLGTLVITFLKKRLEMYYEAEEKILQGQSYTIGSRTLTRTSLANVQSKIKELESEISALETRGNSKRRSVRVVPLG